MKYCCNFRRVWVQCYYSRKSRDGMAAGKRSRENGTDSNLKDEGGTHHYTGVAYLGHRFSNRDHFFHQHVRDPRLSSPLRRGSQHRGRHRLKHRGSCGPEERKEAKCTTPKAHREHAFSWMALETGGPGPPCSSEAQPERRSEGGEHSSPEYGVTHREGHSNRETSP